METEIQKYKPILLGIIIDVSASMKKNWKNDDDPMPMLKVVKKTLDKEIARIARLQKLTIPKRKSPTLDVFCLGIEENGFFAGGGDAIDLAVRGSAYIKISLGIESDGLRGKFGGFENGDGLHTCGGLARGVETKYFCRRTAGAVEDAFRVGVQRPEVGSVGIRQQREFRSQFEAAVAANRDTVSGAFQKFVVGGDAPVASVLRARDAGARNDEKERYE